MARARAGPHVRVHTRGSFSFLAYLYSQQLLVFFVVHELLPSIKAQSDSAAIFMRSIARVYLITLLASSAPRSL